MAERLHRMPDFLQPVLEFVSDSGLSTPSALAAWLLEHRLVSHAVRVTHVEFQLALELRNGLRALALANNGGPADPDTLAPIEWALGQFPLTAQPAVPVSAPATGGKAGAVSSVPAPPLGAAVGKAGAEAARAARSAPAAVLAPQTTPPAKAGLGRLVTGYALAAAAGEWHRLRQCPGCTEVFWDSSAKGGRRWCSMGTCGNRAKVKAFTSRRRAA